MASNVETARTCYEAAEGFDPLARPERFLPAEDGHIVVLGRCVGVARETGVPFDAAFEENIAEHFELFDTICSATQDRQDALFDLLEQPLDVMVVIGGYNSSNTNNLAITSSERVHKSYYIASGDCIEGDAIRHKPAHTPLGAREEVEETAWLPDGPIRVGLTAGASTPNSQIGLTIGCILEARGLSLAEGESRAAVERL